MKNEIKIILIIIIFTLLLILVNYMDNINNNIGSNNDININTGSNNDINHSIINTNTGSIIIKNLKFKNKAVGNGKNSSDIGL